MGMFDMFNSGEEKPDEELIKDVDYTNYEEGIYVGYRHFDKAQLEVSYPFGYGLSYTNFAYNNMEVNIENDTIHVRLTVENTGTRPGKEVVQVYVAKPDTQVDRPVQELKAFAKTTDLAPGDTTNLEMYIPVTEIRYWDEGLNQWALEPGTYTLQLGASSRDIRLSEEVGI